MAKFKCKLSGCVAEFNLEHDIAEMRKHEGYEEVKEVKEARLSDEQPPTVRLVGRPKKQ